MNKEEKKLTLGNIELSEIETSGRDDIRDKLRYEGDQIRIMESIKIHYLNFVITKFFVLALLLLVGAFVWFVDTSLSRNLELGLKLPIMLSIAIVINDFFNPYSVSDRVLDKGLFVTATTNLMILNRVTKTLEEEIIKLNVKMDDPKQGCRCFVTHNEEEEKND
jgi:hypothetical protein